MVRNGSVDVDGYAEPVRQHLPGWLVALGKGAPDRREVRLQAGLQAFVGHYGPALVTRVRPNVAFGFREPRDFLPLTTWSMHEDAHWLTFLEGTFYEHYARHEPQPGHDPDLARLLTGAFEKHAYQAFRSLNGAFSGFLYHVDTQRLMTFVDRMGIKVLYWSCVSDAVVVASNPGAFRALRDVTLDRVAAVQFLSVGYPIGERTLFQDIQIHRPATCNIFQGAGRVSQDYYWEVPPRLPRMSRRDAVESLSVAMEGCLERLERRSEGMLSLGCTGGHDTRVIMGALAYRKIPFLPVRWNEGHFDDQVAAKLCEILGRPLQIAPPTSQLAPETLRELEADVFVYTDGTFFHPKGFSRLARQCAALSSRCLLLGIAGDVISGASTVPAPRYLGSLRKVVDRALQDEMTLLPFQEAAALLREPVAESIAQTQAEWLKSFEDVPARYSLLDTLLFQTLMNRTMKRNRFLMNPALRWTQLLYPYLDNQVLQAYFSLPLSMLHLQKAHCYAGFYRVPAFGAYQASPYPVSLQNEARFPLGLHLLRIYRRQLSALTSRFTSRGALPRLQASPLCHDIRQSSLFAAEAVTDWLHSRHLNLNTLHKMHTLSKMYALYTSGEPSMRPSYDSVHP